MEVAAAGRTGTSHGESMNKVFDQRAEEYDRWFDEHPAIYLSELNALRMAACHGIGLEMGVGTGRFAMPLGVSPA